MQDFDPPIVHADRLQSGLLQREARLLTAMAKHYCQKVHGKKELCEECREHLCYSLTRLACCPYGQNKPACSKCAIRCHKASEKTHIKSVMRTCGPAMLWKYPLLTAEHLFRSLKKAPPHPNEQRRKKS